MAKNLINFHSSGEIVCSEQQKKFTKDIGIYFHFIWEVNHYLSVFSGELNSNIINDLFRLIRSFICCFGTQ